MSKPNSSEMIGEPRSLRKGDFAKRVGVSAGRISQMITDGLPVEPDGRIDVARGEQWVRGNISPSRSAAQARNAPELPLGAQRDAAAERVRLLKEQADSAALKNAERRGELLPARDVERAWSSIFRDVRAAMLALPARIRNRAPHLSAADIAMIDREIREGLRELGDG